MSDHRASGMNIVTLVTVPGLHGNEDAHWQSWLEMQFPLARRVEQRDWATPHLDTWAASVRDVLTDIDGPTVIAAHSFGCLATAHALAKTNTQVQGVLFVAPASPAKFRFAGTFSARRIDAPSLVVGSETDPWMPLDDARTAAAQRRPHSASIAHSSISAMPVISTRRRASVRGRLRGISWRRWRGA